MHSRIASVGYAGKETKQLECLFFSFFFFFGDRTPGREARYSDRFAWVLVYRLASEASLFGECQWDQRNFWGTTQHLDPPKKALYHTCPVGRMYIKYQDETVIQKRVKG